MQMNDSIGLSAAAYGAGAGLFFLTYMLFEPPSNVVMARVGARIWLSRIMVTWGLVTMATALTRLRLPEQESHQIEGLLTLNQRRGHRDQSPRDHDAREPDPCAHPRHHHVGRRLEQHVGQEEQARSSAVRGR